MEKNPSRRAACIEKRNLAREPTLFVSFSKNFVRDEATLQAHLLSGDYPTFTCTKIKEAVRPGKHHWIVGNHVNHATGMPGISTDKVNNLTIGKVVDWMMS